MSGRRWLRAASDTQWVLATTDTTTGIQAIPTVAFTTSIKDGATVRIDASGSFSTNGPITSFVLDFGDGATSSQSAAEHTYAIDGTFVVRVSLTDSLGRTATATKTIEVDSPSSTPNKAPTAALAFTASGLTAVLDASGSTDPDGQVVKYQFSFGDGSPAVVQSTPTISHVYAKAGTYSATVLVTDDDGATASTARQVAVSDPVVTTPTNPTPYVIPWTKGVWSEGLPSTVPIAPFTELYNRLSSSQKTADDWFVLALEQLQPYLAAKGWGSYGAIAFPAGFDEELPGFKRGSSGYWSGYRGTGCVGLLGGIVSGKFQARIRMRPDALTQAQLDYIAANAKNATGANGTGLTAMSFAQNQPTFVMGMQFDGADQQVVQNDSEVSPANWAGFTLYRPGPGSIIQNVLTRGFAKADKNAPPGEVPPSSYTRDVNSILRRCEFDGRLPDGVTRRSGSFMWSASTNATVTDVYAHDSYVSGPTFSIAGSVANGNFTKTITTNDLRSWLNANHNGQVGRLRFSGVNHEEVQGVITHNRPAIGLDDSTRNLWDSTHMTHVWYSPYGPGFAPATSFTVNDPIVLDADKGGAYAGDNGCFSILSRGESASQAAYGTNLIVPPRVFRNGVELTAWRRTGAGAAPAYVTPDKYFIWKKQ